MSGADRWKGELTGDQVDRAIGILSTFGLDKIYGISTMPDLEAAHRMMGSRLPADK